MPVNASHVAGDAGHVADHNTLAAFVNTHDDVDTATTAHHHTIGTAANQAAAGNHAHAVSAATPTTTVVTGSVTGTSAVPSRDDHVHQMGAHDHSTSAKGGQLSQANTHISADTDSSSTALHHTLGIGSNQAAVGSHNHSGVAAEAPYLITPGTGLATAVSINAGTAVYAKMTLPLNWTWGGTAVLLLNGTAASTLYVGFYSDSAGAPGTLIGTPASGSGSAAGTITLTGGSATLPGGVVWLTYLATTGTPSMNAMAPATNMLCSTAPFSTTFYRQASGQTSLTATAPSVGNYSIASYFPLIIAY